ncbi:MAG TPA: DUF4399 domain-containing protein [Gammaproteobacteria bacterium]|nr:DUF4399 domain-containing protein [Gammaproteobacteria bacterium]
MRKMFLALALMVILPAIAASSTPAPSSPGAEVYFIAPADGATVSNPVRVVFGLRGMGVAPAGVAYPNTGHHHLIIDAETPPPGQPIPADDRHRHFGGGQTETEITLPPGRHTLQLVLGDHLHLPHEPPVVSRRIYITVQ